MKNILPPRMSADKASMQNEEEEKEAESQTQTAEGTEDLSIIGAEDIDVDFEVSDDETTKETIVVDSDNNNSPSPLAGDEEELHPTSDYEAHQDDDSILMTRCMNYASRLTPMTKNSVTHKQVVNTGLREVRETHAIHSQLAVDVEQLKQKFEEFCSTKNMFDTPWPVIGTKNEKGHLKTNNMPSSSDDNIPDLKEDSSTDYSDYEKDDTNAGNMNFFTEQPDENASKFSSPTDGTDLVSVTSKAKYVTEISTQARLANVNRLKRAELRILGRRRRAAQNKKRKEMDKRKKN